MDPDTKDTVWYVDLDPEDEEDPGIEEIIEADFLVLRTSHYIPGKQRTVRGSLLLTVFSRGRIWRESRMTFK